MGFGKNSYEKQFYSNKNLRISYSFSLLLYFKMKRLKTNLKRLGLVTYSLKSELISRICSWRFLAFIKLAVNMKTIWTESKTI